MGQPKSFKEVKTYGKRLGRERQVQGHVARALRATKQARGALDEGGSSEGHSQEAITLPTHSSPSGTKRARVPVPHLLTQPTAWPFSLRSLRSGSCAHTWRSKTWIWPRSGRRRYRPRTCCASHTAATRWWRPACGTRKRWPRAAWRSCGPRQVSLREWVSVLLPRPLRSCALAPSAPCLMGDIRRLAPSGTKSTLVQTRKRIRHLDPSSLWVLSPQACVLTVCNSCYEGNRPGRSYPKSHC